MRFKRIRIRYEVDGKPQYINGFNTMKEAVDYTKSVGTDCVIIRSDIKVVSDSDAFSPKWATHVAKNSDNQRYDIRVEDKKLVRAERVNED